jgi:hypothetical protein
MARIASEIIYKLIGDDKDLQKAFTDSKKGADELAKKLSTTGATLTKGLTLPIVAAGAAAVKFAIEAGKAADRILDLEQITGLSTDTLQEFKNVAAVAGVDFESLVGTLGRFTGRLATLESEGGPAAEAVERLGISLRDSNGELRSTEDLFPEFLDGLNQIENLTERNATAQLIFGRSLNDLAPVLALTSDEINNARVQARELGLVQGKEALQAANNFRISVDQLRLQIRAQAQEIGTNLIPIVEDLIPVVGKIVENIAELIQKFVDLPEPLRNTALGLIALAAAAGPVLSIAGKLVAVLPALKVGFAALGTIATGPVGLAVAGVIALGAATSGLIGWVQGLKNEKAEEAYEGIAEAAGLAGKEIRQINSDLEVFAGFGVATTTYAEIVDSLADKFGRTKEEIIAIGLASPTITEESRKQLTTLQSINTALLAEQQYFAGIKESNEAITQQRIEQENLAVQAAQRIRDAEREAELREVARLQNVIEARKKALEDTETQIDIINAKTQSGLLDEEQKRQEILRLYQREIDALFAIGFRTDQNSIGAERLRELIQSVVESRQVEQQVIEETADIVEQNIEEEADLQTELTEKKLSLQERLQRDWLDKQKERNDLIFQNFKAIAGFSDALTQREIQNIEKSELAEDERAEKIAKLKRRQAIFDKAVTITQIAIETARAVVASLPNLVLAGLAGSLGAIQLATAAAKPIPTFATGGSFIVPPGFNGDSFPITSAMVQSGERVTVEPAGSFSQSESRNPMLVRVELDGRTLAESTVDYINGGQVRLEVTG